MDPEQLMVEARAKIVWGEPPESVRYFLISNGMSREEADATLQELNAERYAEIRGIGIQDTIIGGVLTGGVGLLFLLIFSYRGFSTSSGFVKAYALLAMIGLYGLWKLVRGIVYLVRPQSEHQSLSDIDGSDPME